MAGAIAEVGYLPDDTVLIVTTPCCVCGKTHEFQFDRRKYEDWQNGVLIQKVFPELSDGEREILISGTCPACWDELWAE